jgi:hypothetical protein
VRDEDAQLGGRSDVDPLGADPVLRQHHQVGRFGDLNRYGEVTFIAARGHIYAFAWEAGVFDCIATNGFGGPQVYAHVIDTVRFLS